MNKYILKPEFIDCTIITKTSDGTEIVVTAQSFNDYFGELMFKNGQHHLLKVNPLLRLLIILGSLYLFYGHYSWVRYGVCFQIPRNTMFHLFMIHGQVSLV